MSSRNSKKHKSSSKNSYKLSLEERKEINRQKVLSISFMFPTVEIDFIITALMTSKGSMEKAIMLVSEYVHKQQQTNGGGGGGTSKSCCASSTTGGGEVIEPIEYEVEEQVAEEDDLDEIHVENEENDDVNFNENYGDNEEEMIQDENDENDENEDVIDEEQFMMQREQIMMDSSVIIVNYTGGSGDSDSDSDKKNDDKVENVGIGTSFGGFGGGGSLLSRFIQDNHFLDGTNDNDNDDNCISDEDVNKQTVEICDKKQEEKGKELGEECTNQTVDNNLNLDEISSNEQLSSNNGETGETGETLTKIQSSIRQIKDFFPALSDTVIEQALVKCHYNEDDTCSYLVAQYMEYPEEENDWEMIENPNVENHGDGGNSGNKTTLFTSSKWLIIDDYLENDDEEDRMTESIMASSSNFTPNDEPNGDENDDDDDDVNTSDDEENEENGDEYDRDDESDDDSDDEENSMELEVHDTTNFEWFKDAQQAQQSYYEQDEVLARLLQEEEFAKMDQMILNRGAVASSSSTASFSIARSSAEHIGSLSKGRRYNGINFDSFHPHSFWSEPLNIFKKQIRNIVSVRSIVKNDLLQRFRKYCQQAEDPVLVLGYHGTRPSNIESIKRLGLLVPGKNKHGVTVQNGSMLGTGIYVSTSAGQSIPYCYGGNKLIACAVVIGKKCIATRCGEVMVIFNEAQVLPCWEITFQNEYRVTNVSSSTTRPKRKPAATVAPPKPTFALTTIPKRLRAKGKDKVKTKKERKEKKVYNKKKTQYKQALLK